MFSSSQVFCSSCREYKPTDQFNQARNGRLYKNCRACYENRRRQPLGEIDPNLPSLRSGVRRPIAPIRQSRQPKRRRIDPIPTPKPTHALVRAGQGPTETVDLTISPTSAPVQAIPTPEPTHAPVQAGQGPTNSTLSPLLNGRSVPLIPDTDDSMTHAPVQANQGPTEDDSRLHEHFYAWLPPDRICRVEPDDLGAMTDSCDHCQALFWNGERSMDNKGEDRNFASYCSKGDISI